MSYVHVFGITVAAYIVLSVFWSTVVDFMSASFGVKEIYLQTVLAFIFLAELAYFINR